MTKSCKLQNPQLQIFARRDKHDIKTLKRNANLLFFLYGVFLQQ